MTAATRATAQEKQHLRGSENPIETSRWDDDRSRRASLRPAIQRRIATNEASQGHDQTTASAIGQNGFAFATEPGNENSRPAESR
jgi:hypothetical protein